MAWGRSATSRGYGGRTGSTRVVIRPSLLFLILIVSDSETLRARDGIGVTRRWPMRVESFREAPARWCRPNQDYVQGGRLTTRVGGSGSDVRSLEAPIVQVTDG